MPILVAPCDAARLVRQRNSRLYAHAPSRSRASSEPDPESGVLMSTFLDFQIQQQRAERLSVRIERKRPRHAAAERVRHHEIERADTRQLVARHVTLYDIAKQRLHALWRCMLHEPGIIPLVESDKGNIARITLVSGARMGDGSKCHLLSGGLRPAGPRCTLSRAPLRRRAPFAWLTRCRSFALHDTV